MTSIAEAIDLSCEVAVSAEDAKRLDGASLDRVSAAALRVVSLDWIDGRSTEHMVIVDQLDVFVEACKRLHFSPGVNPYNGVETARIWRLRVAELRGYGPYWWAKSELDVKPSAGAFTVRGGISQTVWRDENHDPDQRSTTQATSTGAAA